VEGDGGKVEEVDEGGGENVLGGVLLHVIAPAGGIDLTVDAGSGLKVSQGSIEVMDDAAVFGVGDFGDTKFVVAGEEGAGIVDLASAGGIEGGPVENDGGTRGFEDGVDFGVEVVEEGIVVVEAVGHGFKNRDWRLGYQGCGPMKLGRTAKSGCPHMSGESGGHSRFLTGKERRFEMTIHVDGIFISHCNIAIAKTFLWTF
jgi:hypothetical protein